MLGVIVCSLLSLVGGSLGDDGPLVSTSLGQVRGRTLRSRAGREYSAFTRIPFALPPIGNLRFKAPVPYNFSWVGEYNASLPNTHCAQYSITFQGSTEDCLYLEISTPNVNGSFPVMFSVYGGAFWVGHPGSPNSAAYFMDEDVVIVNTNYRLGSFGFLDLGDNEISGNMGLKDQAMALEWVYKEIKNFGGDPNLITSYGISAGGMSANILCSSPRTRGFLKGCISQSGVASTPLCLARPWLSAVTGLTWALLQGCPPWNLVPCLQALPTHQVTTIIPLLFKPVIDGDKEDSVIPQWPPEFNNFPWIVGHTQNEGALVTGAIENFLDHHIVELLEDLIKAANRCSPIFKFIPGLQWLGKLFDRFFKTNDVFNGLEKFLTEVVWIYPELKEMERHYGPKYFYNFNYAGGPSFWRYILHNGNLNVSGVCHADDAPYFKNDSDIYPYPPNWPSARDIKFSQTLIKLWVNFAREQNPSPKNFNPDWEQYVKNNVYLDMNNNGISTQRIDNANEIIEFWDGMWFIPLLSPLP